MDLHEITKLLLWPFPPYFLCVLSYSFNLILSPFLSWFEKLVLVIFNWNLEFLKCLNWIFFISLIQDFDSRISLIYFLLSPIIILCRSLILRYPTSLGFRKIILAISFYFFEDSFYLSFKVVSWLPSIAFYIRVYSPMN